MTGLFILGAIILIIVVICSLRVGAMLQYTSDGFEFIIRIAFVHITVYSSAKKGERAKKKDKKAAKAGKAAKKDDKKPKRDFGVGGLSENIAFVRSILSRLIKASRIDMLRIRFVAASRDDPAKAAIMYGRAWAAEGIIYGLLENNIGVRNRDISIELDYAAEKPVLTFLLQLSTTIGKNLWAALGVIRDYYTIRRNRSTRLQEKGGA